MKDDITSTSDDEASTQSSENDDPQLGTNESEENLFNTVTCLLPEEPLNDVVGKIISTTLLWFIMKSRSLTY